jgi:hypothetical protein
MNTHFNFPHEINTDDGSRKGITNTVHFSLYIWYTCFDKGLVIILYIFLFLWQCDLFHIQMQYGRLMNQWDVYVRSGAHACMFVRMQPVVAIK